MSGVWGREKLRQASPAKSAERLNKNKIGCLWNTTIKKMTMLIS